MNDFKKNNRFGGGRGGFGKRDFGGRGGGFDGPRDMYDAVCASCGKTCQVPFRPNGKKPIYCKECFAENGGPTADRRDDRRDSNSFAPRREFSRPSFDRPQTTSANSTNFDIADIKKQVQNLNSKIDSLIVLLGEKKPAPAAAPASAPVAPKGNQIVVSAKALEKKPAKKAPAKKKAK